MAWKASIVLLLLLPRTPWAVAHATLTRTQIHVYVSPRQGCLAPRLGPFLTSRNDEQSSAAPKGGLHDAASQPTPTPCKERGKLERGLQAAERRYAARVSGIANIESI